MITRFKSLLRSFSLRRQRVQPLVQRHHDVAVLKALHGRRFPGLRQVRQLKKILTPVEKRIFRWSMLVLLLGLGWYAFVFASSHRTSVPAVGGRYIEAVVGTPQLINPLFASLNEVDRDLSQLIYSGLMRFDEQQQLIPDVAERYEISEDKKTYTFFLRQDVRWHRGSLKEDAVPLTARDVAFTFELILNPETGSPLAISYQGVDIEVIDEYTIAFTLSEPFQPFLSSLTVGILPLHVWGQIPPAQIRLAQNNVQPVGTGPYRFSKLMKNQSGFISRYELLRNADFYRHPAYIEEFVFDFFHDYDGDFGAIEALREGKVDGIHFVPSSLKYKVERKHIVIHTLQLPQYSALFFNQTRAPKLENVDVRRALAQGLDKDRILRESLKNEGQVIQAPILPGFPGYDAAVTTAPYSADAANELLDKTWERVTAATYLEQQRELLLKELQGLTSSTPSTTEGGQVSTSTPVDDALLAQIDEQLESQISEAQTFYRKDKDGKIIEIDLVTAATEEYHTAAQLIAGFWQELGIKTNITEVDPRTIQRDVLRNREYDVLLYGIIIGSDPDQYPFWHSSQVNYPGLNLSGYVNRDIDTLLEDIRETDDAAALEARYKQLQEKIIADWPAVFLYTPVYRYAMSDRLQGFVQTRIFHPTDRLDAVTDWYVKTKGKWQF